MRLSNYVNIELGEGGLQKNCEHLNQSRRVRVSCLQNFNVSQQVLSKIVAIFLTREDSRDLIYVWRKNSTQGTRERNNYITMEEIA